MISYADVPDLEGPTRDRIVDLLERSNEIWDLPEDLDKVQAWEELVDECERAEFPHLAASARFGQYSTLRQAGMVPETFEAYVRLMQLIHRHGDYIAPANLHRFLDQVPVVVSTLAEEPSFPLARMAQAIDLVEREIRARSGDMASIHLARAYLAAATGDGRATFDWLNRWHAEGSPEWRADDPGTVEMEIPTVARFDPAGAAQLLEQRLRTMDIALDRVDLEHPDADSHLRLVTLWGALQARLGRRDAADRIADQLLQWCDTEELARISIPENLLVVLENRPAEAQVAVDRALANHSFDETDWEITAAMARNRILADPDGEEGRLLQALAEQAVEAHDLRGGTDVHRLELHEFWWSGLAPGPRPRALDDPGVWADREERAEHILAAGWLQRTTPVVTDDPPIGIKYRYLALMEEVAAVLTAPTPVEAAEMAERLYARGKQLRCPTACFGVRLMHALHAGQAEDVAGLVRGFELAQQELEADHPWIEPSLRAAAEGIFTTVVQLMVADPGTSWQRIEALIQAEARLRDRTGAPRTPLIQARAEIAAHLGDGPGLHRLVGEIAAQLESEEDQLDRHAIDLAVVRMASRYATNFAGQLAQWIAETGDLEQRRAATAWLCWLRNVSGDRGGAAELLALLDSVDRDLEEFGVLPHWVLLEGAAGGGDIAWLIDAVLADSDPDSGGDLSVTAAAGSALLALAPEDERGPRLRSSALRIAARLDERNGNSYWSDLVRDRWFPGHTGEDLG